MAVWWKRLFGRNSEKNLPGYTAEDSARIRAQFADFDRELRRAEAESRANPYHPDPNDDPAVESALRAAPPEAWHRLWSAVDEFLAEETESQANWRFHNSDGSLSFPHVDYSDAINRMVEALYAVDAIVGFPWMRWDFKSAHPGGRGLDTAPVATAVRVLTALVRGERFSDGTILEAMRDGTLACALQRLRTWFEQQAID